MSLLTPEAGLLFWMMISFGIVLLILARYGFPVILKAVEKRKNYIEASLVAAREAQEELGKVVQTGERMLAEARRDQHAILKETTRLKEQLIEEARAAAAAESEKMLASARKKIEAEKEEALRTIRREVSTLSVELAERILREKLGDEQEQMKMIDRLLDEVDISKA
ncbi:MAG: ATP synthase F0 subunit B [Bacteroidia bacterium]|jgi:F-type H+-transporting ATPase subunit b|nr:F0F1 ATP synthase subunit B [Proteiniphilum sp.]NCD14507.1 ATP synthase F0 subunit B [Bacteroidia bacterium]